MDNKPTTKSLSVIANNVIQEKPANNNYSGISKELGVRQFTLSDTWKNNAASFMRLISRKGVVVHCGTVKPHVNWKSLEKIAKLNWAKFWYFSSLAQYSTVICLT